MAPAGQGEELVVELGAQTPPLGVRGNGQLRQLEGTVQPGLGRLPGQAGPHPIVPPPARFPRVPVGESDHLAALLGHQAEEGGAVRVAEEDVGKGRGVHPPVGRLGESLSVHLEQEGEEAFHQFLPGKGSKGTRATSRATSRAQE